MEGPGLGIVASLGRVPYARIQVAGQNLTTRPPIERVLPRRYRARTGGAMIEQIELMHWADELQQSDDTLHLSPICAQLAI
jgi:hypothetical protein